MATGGFDIVIGNPPYGAKTSEKDKTFYKKIYEAAQTLKGIQKGSTDTFAIFINQGYNLLRKNGNLAFIVPMAITSSDAMTALHNLLENNCKTIRISSYSNRPKQIFDAACIRTSIFMMTKTLTPTENVFTSKLVRRRKDDSIAYLIDNLTFEDTFDYKLFGRYAKAGTKIEVDILKKIFSTGKTLEDYKNDNGKAFYYRTSGGRYYNIMTLYTTNSSKENSMSVNETNIIVVLLSSSLFWFYQQVYTNGIDLKQYEVNNFPVPDISKIDTATKQKIISAYKKYIKDVEANAILHESSSYSVGSFKEYKIVKSKNIIDEIDDLICPLYGLTKEETDFIKNYELEFRMSGDDE